MTLRIEQRGLGGHIRRLIAGAALIAAALGIPAVMTAQGPAYDGRPAFREGWDFGYYVWRDGTRWHVRWTTRGATHHFSGHVVAEGGRLDDLKRIDVETESRVVRPGRAPHVVRGPRGRARVAPGHGAVVATRAQDHVDLDDHRRIDFSAKTDDDIDGFDFDAKDGVDALRFTLEIDGRSRAQDVEIGRDNAHPSGNPFVAKLK